MVLGGAAGAGGRDEVLLTLLRSVPQLCLPADRGTGAGPIRVACAAADDHGSAVGEAADDTAACSISKRTARCWSSPQWEGRPAIRAGTTTSSPTPRSRYRHAPANAGCEPSPWSVRPGIAGSSGSRPQQTDTQRTSPALIGRYRSWRCGRSRPAQMVIPEVQAEYEAPEVSLYAGPFRRRRLAHPVPIVRPVRSPVRFAQRHRGPRLVRPWTREPRWEWLLVPLLTSRLGGIRKRHLHIRSLLQCNSPLRSQLAMLSRSEPFAQKSRSHQGAQAPGR